MTPNRYTGTIGIERMLYLRETRMVAAEHRQDEQDVLAGALRGTSRENMNDVRQARLAQPLIGTLVYAAILTVLLIMPMSGTNVRRGYLRELNLRSTWHSLVDIAVNIAAFVPLGWGLHRVSRRLGLFTAKTTLIAVAVAVALFSLVIETVQYFLPTRYSSILDVAADTVGGILGSWLELRTGRDAREQP